MEEKSILDLSRGGVKKATKKDYSANLIKQLYNNGTKPNLSKNYKNVFKEEMMNTSNHSLINYNLKLVQSFSDMNSKASSI